MTTMSLLTQSLTVRSGTVRGFGRSAERSGSHQRSPDSGRDRWAGDAGESGARRCASISARPARSNFTSRSLAGTRGIAL